MRLLRGSALVVALVVFSVWVERHPEVFRRDGKRGGRGIATVSLGPIDLQGAEWVQAPDEVGESLPPAGTGRSLFDYLFTTPGVSGARVYDVPYPFPKLIERINAHLEAGADPSETGKVKGVLIPLGRSLQRNASAPDKFFLSPRVVIFVDSPSRQARGEVVPQLKDRLYVGYHERSGVMEAISYNEKAARFDYQVVHDYRPGMTPQVFYAQRAICIGCHQNHTPIFSVRNWLETNANPKVSDQIRNANPIDGHPEGEIASIPGRVTEQGGARFFHGVPMVVPETIPNQFEDATERAQLFLAQTRVWREGCDDGSTPDRAIACRRAALTLALRQALVGDLRPGVEEREYQEDFLPTQTRAWQKRWKVGLAIPNPNLPNRDPFKEVKESNAPVVLDPKIPPEIAKLMRESTVPVDKDPGTPGRAPFDVWTLAASEKSGPHQLLAGLARNFSLSDLRTIDGALATRSLAALTPKSYAGICEVKEVANGAQPAVTNLQIACAEPAALPGTASGSARLKALIRQQNGQALDGSFDVFQVKPATSACQFASSAPGALLCSRLNNVGVSQGAVTTDGTTGLRTVELTLGRKPSFLNLRLPDGSWVEKLIVRWKPGQAESGTLELRYREDFGLLKQALAALASESAAVSSDGGLLGGVGGFQRTAFLRKLYAKLAVPAPTGATFNFVPDSDGAMPTPKFEGMSGSVLGQKYEVFVRRCAKCHDNPKGNPPNFLTGDSEAVVEKQLVKCAPRILYRLYEWDKPEDHREMGGMPYASAIRDPDGKVMSEAAWLAHPDLRTLRDQATARLKAPWTLDAVLQIADPGTLPACKN